MQSPQLYQQSIEVHQSLAVHFLNRFDEVNGGTDSDPDPPKVFEFDRSKRFSDPLDVRDVRPKVYMSEFCDFGEVERRWLPRCASKCGGDKTLFISHRSLRERTCGVATNLERFQGVRTPQQKIQYGIDICN